MEAEKIGELITKASDELLEQMKDSYTTRNGWNTARKYILGLMSGAERKNSWQLSEQLGEHTPYRLQQFLYRGSWDADRVRDQLRSYVCEHWGEPNGVLVVDETGFLKQGKRSAGVKRQYSGTAGRVENCQIGVFLTYASQKGHCMIDRALYLPEEWTDDPERCKKAGIPEGTKFQTKPEQALTMLRSAHEAEVPFAWVTGDSVYGDPGGIRTYLESIGKQYVMAVSGKTYVWMGMRQVRISEIMEHLPDNGWQRLSTGAGSKGEKYYDWLSLPITCAIKGFRKYFLVRRSLSHPEKRRGYLCCCKENTPLLDLVRVAGTRWTVEMCFAETKGDVGFDHYEVRSWQGWYRHITLAMCAHALLSVLKAELLDRTTASFFLPGESGGSLDAFKKGRNILSASAKQNSENCCGVS